MAQLVWSKSSKRSHLKTHGRNLLLSTNGWVVGETAFFFPSPCLLSEIPIVYRPARLPSGVAHIIASEGKVNDLATLQVRISFLPPCLSVSFSLHPLAYRSLPFSSSCNLQLLFCHFGCDTSRAYDCACLAVCALAPADCVHSDQLPPLASYAWPTASSPGWCHRCIA